MFKRIFFILLVLIISHKANADEVNLQLGDNSARVIYAAEVFGGSVGPTDLDMGGYINKDGDALLQIGLSVRNDALDNPLIISIGTRFYYADAGNQDGQVATKASALAFGGELLYVPNIFNGFGFGFSYYTSPSVTTFQDANRFTEFAVILNYAISEVTGFYVGYRNLELKFDNASNIVLEDGFMFGFRFRLEQ